MLDWQGFKVDEDNPPLHRPGMYRFTNLLDGKTYIGVSGDVYERGRQHSASVVNGRSKFCKALRTFGVQSFLFEPLCYGVDVKALDNRWLFEVEAISIADHNSVSAGYNVLSQACGLVGPITQEFRDIVSEACLEVWARKGGHTPEARAKISNASKDWWATHTQTPDQRAAADLNAQKMLAASPANKPGWVPVHRIGMKDTEETKARRSASKRATHETRREQGLQHIWITDGVQECQILNTAPIPPGWYQGRQPKIGEVGRSRVGETRTEVACQHMSTSALNAWSDPAKREAMMRNRRPFCWITNGAVSRRLQDDEEMPEGFWFGMTKRCPRRSRVGEKRTEGLWFGRQTTPRMEETIG